MRAAATFSSRAALDSAPFGLSGFATRFVTPQRPQWSVLADCHTLLPRNTAMKQAKLALLYRDVVSDAKLINSMPALGAALGRAFDSVRPVDRCRVLLHQHPQREVLANGDRVSPANCRAAARPLGRSAYTRTKLADADDWSLSLICWAPGAASPIHNHVELTSVRRAAA